MADESATPGRVRMRVTIVGYYDTDPSWGYETTDPVEMAAIDERNPIPELLELLTDPTVTIEPVTS